MPTYKPARHGVELSQAVHEAAVLAPTSRVMLDTFELYHPLGTPDGPVYVVNNDDDYTATIESTADRAASEEVTFLKSGIKPTFPEESDQASMPEISLTLSGVSGVLSDALRTARGSLDPWELIWRIYAHDEPSAPAKLPPLSLLVTAVDMDGETVKITASFGDSVNVAVPRITFKRTEYPGLVR